MTVFDDYIQLGLLGEGSFGKVYKVQSKKDNAYYAMKEISYGQMKAKEKELLVSEVNLLRKLEHTSIVRYIDRYQDKARCIMYIVMEFCGAGDLSKYIKQCKQAHKYMDEEQVWSVFLQILSAVDYCHNPPSTSQLQQKLVNRDLKPANVFLTDQKTIKVGDFGLCRLLEDNQIARTNVGTPLYMAPELLENKSYNEKVDIWSLGCILYEMCALQPPYVATSMESLKIKVAGGVRPLVPSQYSADLKNVINLMLQKDSMKRPGTKQLLQLSCISTRLNFVKPMPQQQVIAPQIAIVEQVNRIPQLPPMQQQQQYVPYQPKPTESELRRREQELKMKEQLLSQQEAACRQRCMQLGLNYDLI
ncbi:Kinase [Hexamita inflata]|uniref:non-specific serine/threonine protein kinase n=1 Tax=Hexamita inflata TaxID=28002 RepID=A0AA86TTM5_9EUKA|nr:Kinase [Hexamita inflata]